MGDKPDTAQVNRAVVRLFAAGNGVGTLAELEAVGVDRRVASRRVAAGRLFRLHRGVYSIVPPRLLKVEGHWRAAVLACGEGAALSHRSAAALWGLRRPQSGGSIHVTVPTTVGRSPRTGIAIHRSRTLPPSQTTLRRHIPVTNPARTLADLRRTSGRHAYASALRQAEILRLDTGPQAQPDPDPDPTRTELERRFFALCRRHSLPRALTQQVVGPYTVDFLWPEQRLVVEVDGYGSHGTHSAFEADRARDAQLKLLGYEVIRFTWRQISAEPATVVAVMHGLLAHPP